MKKSWKKWVYLAGAVVLLYCIGCGIYLAVDIWKDSKRSSLDRHEQSWSIDLPDDLREVYQFDTPSSFHGDGTYYFVYETGSLEHPFYEDFSEQPDAAVERRIQEIVSGITIPAEQQLSLETGYAWKELHRYENVIYFIWSADRTRLFFVEYIQ